MKNMNILQIKNYLEKIIKTKHKASKKILDLY